jgi:hypothetical protein
MAKTNETRIRCLTVQQPYAHLLMSGVKRVENRTWGTHYRGPLVIHAGSGTQYLKAYEASGGRVSRVGTLLGHALGIIWLETCLKVDQTFLGAGRRRWTLPDGYQWLRRHPHAEGPVLWVMGRRVPFTNPVKMKGQQGLFTFPLRRIWNAVPEHERDAIAAAI